MRAEFYLAEKKTKCDEYGGRILLGYNTSWVEGHAAANQVPVVFSLVFNWNPMYSDTSANE